MRFFDTHAHYTDRRFAEEFPGGADALLTEVFAANVERIVNVATNCENAVEVCRQAAKYDKMFAAVGIHPEDCLEMVDPDAELEKLSALLDRKDELKIVAIGEIGLDYHWDVDHKDKQNYFFDKQLTLSEKYDLPVIVHDREAHGDCFDMVLAHKNARGVFHSFSGSPEFALELVKRGWYISFSGSVSFKNASKVREAAKIVPSDRILIETDCPYMAPEPFRGRLNRSDLLVYTLNAVAAAKNLDPEPLSEQIFENSCRFFEI